MSRRWLVTGGSGFIGTRFVRFLQASGDDVTIVTRRPPRSAAEIQCDLLDGAVAEDLGRQCGATHLALLAWTTEHQKFWDDDANLLWLRANERLVRGFLDGGGKTVLGVGTCAEYAWEMNPLKEDESRLAPATPYGVAKHALSSAIAAACDSTGASALWGRVFFVYGRGENPEKLASSLVRRRLESRRFEVREPDRRLDFIHVDDVATAFLTIASNGIAGSYNIATGAGATVRDLARIVGCELETPVQRREPASPDVVADVSKLTALGWKPSVTLDAGLDDLSRSIEEGNA